MSTVYVVGGRQKRDAPDSSSQWGKYEAGLVLLVDGESGEVGQCLEYVSPPEVCPPESPSTVFKAGTVDGGRLYVPTTTEVLVYALPGFEGQRYVSAPCFNDVHHVLPIDDGAELLVANTGLDMVVAVDEAGNTTREWSVTEEPTWSRFSREVDYRRVASTKPHFSHPNFVFQLEDDLWATRCNQFDAVCLTREHDPIRVADGLIHDGVVRGDSIYFTVVSGEVVIVDAGTKEVRRRVDLSRLDGATASPGWCRGIEVLDEEHVIVGFSRLRPTRWRQNVRWVKHRLGGSGAGLAPTRIAMFDLKRERLCWEVDLEPAGMNAVFSVHLQS